MEDLHLTLDVIIGIIVAESLEFFILKIWEYIDHNYRTPLDYFDLEE